MDTQTQATKVNRVLEWDDGESRARYLESDVSNRFLQVIDQAQVQTDFLIKVSDLSSMRIISDYTHPFLCLCEVKLSTFR